MLTITLDPSHYAYVGCTTEQMTTVSAHERHVQIRPTGPGITRCKVPENQVVLSLLLGSLHAARYSGWIASEFVWMEKWRYDEVVNTSESKRLGELLTALISEVGW